MRVFFFFILFISAVSSQELIANVISTSTNQPCYNIDARLVNSTDNTNQNRFECSTATIIQLSLSPSDSSQPNVSPTLVFRALPTSSGTYNQLFQSTTGDPATLCADPTVPACQTAVESENLFTVDISMSSVQVKYQLEPIGLTIPFTSWYHTAPYALNVEVAVEACGIDPYSDVTNNPPDSPWNYAKPVNTITMNKYNVTFPSGSFPSGQQFGPDGLYSKYLLSYYSLTVPGDESGKPPDQCSNPNTIALCTFNFTAVRGGEISRQFYSSGELILDPIYNRWLNGTLGAGEAFGVDDLFFSPSGPTSYQNSAQQCTTPIGSASIDPLGNFWTTNVCPGNPIPNFKVRNNNLYPTYCINGPCAGLTEAYCPLVAGFQYGFSRCLVSQSSALEYMQNSIQPTTSVDCGDFCNGDFGQCACDADQCATGTIEKPIFSTICDSEGFHTTSQQWYMCLRRAYLRNVPALYNPNMFSTFEDTLNNTLCGAYMQGVTGPFPPVTTIHDYDVLRLCPYPLISHGSYDLAQDLAGICRNKVGPYCYSPGTAPNWALDTATDNNINAVRQFVVPFQDYTSRGNYQVGFCGESSVPPGTNPGSEPRRVSPTITTSPCPCSGMNGWQDTVIPVGPLCTVYRLTNPGQPTYEIDITVKSNLGGEPCVMTIGSSVGMEGQTIISSSCNNTVAAFDVTVDNPRGNVLPSLYGYIVICGDVEDDEIGGGVYVKSFYGGEDKSGRTNPYDRLDTMTPDFSKSFRTPLPSTMRDMFSTQNGVPATSSSSNCTKDAQGNCAWWYYVPPAELNQYGEGCGPNGFVNYGVYETTSATTMCENRPGTCVPGYDTRGYDARRFDNNATSNLDGYPYKWPVTKTPAFVARTFADYERQKTTGVPINLPPGWQAANPSYWINDGYLFSNTGKTGGPVFPSGSLFARIELAVAGQLLAAATSFAPGELCYMPNNLPPNSLINKCETDPANQLITSCNLLINGGGGTLQTIVHNTGTQVGTYTMKGNCTNGASVDSIFDFSVQPNTYTQVNLAMTFVNINGENPVCDITLYVGFSPDVALGTPLRYQCYMVKNAYDAPGTIVVSTEPISTSGLPNQNDHSGLGPQACSGDTPGWWCFKWFHYKAIMVWIVTLLLSILIFALLIWAGYAVIRFFKGQETEVQMEELDRQEEINRQESETLQEIEATKQLSQVNKKLQQQAETRKNVLMSLSGGKIE
jgi:hypothetical protein